MGNNAQSMREIPVIELRHVEKYYGSLHVLKDIDLSVSKGEVVVIIGPSGSGKSTLCRTINRLETIDSGEILINGEPLPLEGRKLAGLRARVGMVFQSFNLFAHKTILDNVTMGPTDVLHMSKAKAREEAMQLLKRVGVDSQAAKLPAQLSGGYGVIGDALRRLDDGLGPVLGRLSACLEALLLAQLDDVPGGLCHAASSPIMLPARVPTRTSLITSW